MIGQAGWGSVGISWDRTESGERIPKERRPTSSGSPYGQEKSRADDDDSTS